MTAARKQKRLAPARRAGLAALRETQPARGRPPAGSGRATAVPLRATPEPRGPSSHCPRPPKGLDRPARVALLAAARLVGSLVLAPVGCVHLPATGFDQQTANAFARDPMRQMRTANLDVTYPAAEPAAAFEIAQALDGCVERIRRAMPPDHIEGRVNVLITGANYNNAFVSPAGSSARTQMLVPLHFALEKFQSENNLGGCDMGTVACHEAVHYLIFQQVKGDGGAIRKVVGNPFPSVDALAVERWFHEGMAVWLESDMKQGRGRLASPTFRGRMEAFVASRPGRLRYQVLSEYDRQSYPAGSGPYLVGAHFVAYLASHYGEAKLWQVVDRQGEAFLLAPLFARRFHQVYGAGPGELFARFAASVEAVARARQRPAGQRTITAEVGPSARIATCPREGLVAVADAGLDQLAALSVRRADGSVVWSKRTEKVFADAGPWASSAGDASGLSFSADCRRLFVAAAHPDTQGVTTTTLYEADARTGRWLRQWPDLGGIGGGVDPAGERFAFVRVEGGRASLAVRDLATGVDAVLPAVDAGSSLGSPVFSPDGRRIAFAAQAGAGFNIFVRDEVGEVTPLTADAAVNYGPRWLDDDRIAFVRGIAGRAQAAEFSLATGRLRQVTDAPHAVADPSPAGSGGVVFLNAAGLGWTLDAVESPATPAASSSPAPAAQAVVPANPGGRHGGSPPADAALRRPAAPFAVLEDAPYRGTDSLWWPTARVPYFTVGATLPRGLGWTAGLSLAGQDRLGYHAYVFRLGYVELTNLPELEAAYRNNTLSPLSLATVASFRSSPALRDYRAQLTATRRWQWTTGQMGLLVSDRRQRSAPWLADAHAPWDEADRHRAAMHSLGWTWRRSLATAYGDTRQGIYGGILAAVSSLGSGPLAAFTNLRAEMSAVLAVPGTRRQSASLGAQGWAVLGDPNRRVVLDSWPQAAAPIISELTAVSVDGASMPAVHPVAARQLGILQGDYRVWTVIDQGLAPTRLSSPVFLSGLLWRGFGALVASRGPVASEEESLVALQPLAGGDLSAHVNVFAIPLRLTAMAAYAPRLRRFQYNVVVRLRGDSLWPQAPDPRPSGP